MTTLLVASAGGHLRELVVFRPRIIGLEEDVIWVTWDSAQSRALLRDEPRVVMVRETPPRDVVAILSNSREALRLVRQHKINALVTTGSQLVMPFIALARARGASCHFIESAARSTAPSLTGRLVRRMPGVRYNVQYPNRDAPYVGSVFDGYRPDPVDQPVSTIKRAVVVLGTMPNHEFPRLLARLAPLLGPEVETLWQVGVTRADRYGIEARRFVPADELQAAMRDADVVVAHAGVGTALDALDAGKHPVLVPRRLAHGEHIDDHQIQIAELLAARGLVSVHDADDLTADHLLAAAAKRTTRAEPPPVHLRW